MQTVLTKTVIGIAAAVFINIFFYLITGDETLVLFSTFALCFAIPITLGYLSCAFLNNSYNTFIYILAFLLLAINALLIAFSSVLFFFAFAFLGIHALPSFSYLAVGYYVFYETLQNTSNIPIKNKQKIVDFEEDILDDNL